VQKQSGRASYHRLKLIELCRCSKGTKQHIWNIAVQTGGLTFDLEDKNDLGKMGAL
jgi:hypothetical protein